MLSVSDYRKLHTERNMIRQIKIIKQDIKETILEYSVKTLPDQIEPVFNIYS